MLDSLFFFACYVSWLGTYSSDRTLHQFFLPPSCTNYASATPPTTASVSWFRAWIHAPIRWLHQWTILASYVLWSRRRMVRWRLAYFSLCSLKYNTWGPADPADHKNLYFARALDVGREPLVHHHLRVTYWTIIIIISANLSIWFIFGSPSTTNQGSISIWYFPNPERWPLLGDLKSWMRFLNTKSARMSSTSLFESHRNW